MKCICLLLVILLGASTNAQKKMKKGSTRHSVREAPIITMAGDGYHYPSPSSGSITLNMHDGLALSLTAPSFGATTLTGGAIGNHGTTTINGGTIGNFGTTITGGGLGTIGGTTITGGTLAGGTTLLNGGSTLSLTSTADSVSELPPPMVDIENLTAMLDASVQNSAITVNSGPSFGVHGLYNAGNLAIHGTMVHEQYPSIFNFKPSFEGKDLNTYPHILPPDSKSIEELQREADEKLKELVATANQNHIDTQEKIKALKGNYGYGTFGYDGFNDNTFKITGQIDLGTHQGIDYGTSIDYNALKAPDGKLKLPVQKVFHTKTVGIHIPQPYPVKHEVPVPAPYPVPHPIPVPHHVPTTFTAVSFDDLATIADRPQLTNFAIDNALSNEGVTNVVVNGNGATGQYVPSNDLTVNIGSRTPTTSYNAPTSTIINNEPAQVVVETPRTEQVKIQTNFGADEYIEDLKPPSNSFGIPSGFFSGSLGSYGNEYGSASEEHDISSEVGNLDVPSFVNQDFKIKQTVSHNNGYRYRRRRQP